MRRTKKVMCFTHQSWQPASEGQAQECVSHSKEHITFSVQLVLVAGVSEALSSSLAGLGW